MATIKSNISQIVQNTLQTSLCLSFAAHSLFPDHLRSISLPSFLALVQCVFFFFYLFICSVLESFISNFDLLELDRVSVSICADLSSTRPLYANFACKNESCAWMFLGSLFALCPPNSVYHRDSIVSIRTDYYFCDAIIFKRFGIGDGRSLSNGLHPICWKSQSMFNITAAIISSTVTSFPLGCLLSMRHQCQNRISLTANNFAAPCGGKYATLNASKGRAQHAIENSEKSQWQCRKTNKMLI